MALRRNRTRSDADVAASRDSARAGTAAPAGNVLGVYTRQAPTPQLAVDIFEGQWSTALPPEVGARAGEIGLYADDRIQFFIARSGGVAGSSVLELGPLEASHTYMLERAGSHVTAVESNSRAYLKCLIVKELVPLTGSRFLYGDFLPYLEAVDHRFDLLVASGVLYHAPDPVRLLRAMARCADQIGLWTHYYDATVMRSNAGFDRLFDEAHAGQAGGRPVTLHRRNYLEALQFGGFCGGPEHSAVWMELPDLLDVLADLGFDDIAIGADDTNHPHGPNVLLHARRTGGG